jgi:hypothetical protein
MSIDVHIRLIVARASFGSEKHRSCTFRKDAVSPDRTASLTTDELTSFRDTIDLTFGHITRALEH